MTARVLAAVLLLSAASPALASRRDPPGQVDLNKASVEELMKLPGVGRHKAEEIVARRVHKPFAHAEEVTELKGLGKKWFEKHKAHLSVGKVATAHHPTPPVAKPAAHPLPRR